MINKERKKFGLAPRARPAAKQKALNECALIDDGHLLGYCYIRFTEELVKFVGRELPRGVAPFDPAFIRVRKGISKWLVEAVYYSDGVSAVLWESDEKPAWVQNVKFGDNRAAKNHTQKEARSAANSAGSGTESDTRS